MGGRECIINWLTGDVVRGGQCQREEGLQGVRVDDALVLLQLAGVQRPAHLLARSLWLAMDDGEEDEQVAHEREGEEGGRHGEEEELQK